MKEQREPDRQAIPTFSSPAFVGEFFEPRRHTCQDHSQRFMDGWMHVCNYVCMHACMLACMDVLHAWMYGCMDAWMYVCMHVCMCVCVHVCMCACLLNLYFLSLSLSLSLSYIYIYIYGSPPHVPTISLLVQVVVLSTQSPLNRAFGKSSTVLSYTVASSRKRKDLRTLKNQKKLHTGTQSTGKTNKSSTQETQSIGKNNKSGT